MGVCLFDDCNGCSCHIAPPCSHCVDHTCEHGDESNMCDVCFEVGYALDDDVAYKEYLKLLDKAGKDFENIKPRIIELNKEKCICELEIIMTSGCQCGGK